MAQSIKQGELVSPIVVLKVDDHFELVAGERRWRAFQRLCRAKIPSIIKTDIDNKTLAILSITDNIQNEPLSIFEEAESYQHLIVEFRLSHKEIGDSVGKSRAYITNTIRMLGLEKEVVELILDKNEHLDKAHGKALLGLEGNTRLTHARLCNKNKWAVNVLEKKIAEYNRMFISSINKAVDPIAKQYDFIAEKLSEHLNAPTKIEYNNKTGVGFVKISFTDINTANNIFAGMGFKLDD